MTPSRLPIPAVAADRAPRILIAEDDSAAAEMLRLLLTNVGYEVRIATDGAEALRMSTGTPAPDIVLLDWMLPEVTGLEVCRTIRARADALSLPILMVTAKADLESKSAAFAAGANDYITKPFLGAELRARVAAHLRIKQLSDERRLMDEHLMERDKLSTLGLLVSGVAHDLNNPLGGIYGYAQLLLEQETDPDKRASVERIILDVKRCNRIVSDLLSFARRHSPEWTAVAVGDVLERTLDLRDRQLRAAGIAPALTISSALPTIAGDVHQLQQVFVNILINAEHALREGGTTLKIDAACAGQWGEPRQDWVAIRFFNDGPQIPPDLVERIFDPFVTTKAAEEGTGLGLAICQRIVREHAGEIRVESTPAGTTFSILLPGVSESLPVVGAAASARSHADDAG
jgi:signal transduction histidine kinase